MFSFVNSPTAYTLLPEELSEIKYTITNNSLIPEFNTSNTLPYYRSEKTSLRVLPISTPTPNPNFRQGTERINRTRPVTTSREDMKKLLISQIKDLQ